MAVTKKQVLDDLTAAEKAARKRDTTLTLHEIAKAKDGVAQLREPAPLAPPPQPRPEPTGKVLFDYDWTNPGVTIPSSLLNGVGEGTPRINDGAIELALTGTQRRCELAFPHDFTEGETTTLELLDFEIIPGMVYGGATGNRGHNLFTQFKGNDSKSPILALELWEERDGKGLWLANSQATQKPNAFLCPITEGTKHTIAFTVTASTQGKGSYLLLLDGQHVATGSGLTTVNPGTNGAYWKCGLYRGDGVNGASGVRVGETRVVG